MGEYVSKFTGSQIDDLLGAVNDFDTDNVILWEGAKFMNGDSAVSFSQKASEQKHGIVLVFSLFDNENNVADNASWSCHFVPKSMIVEDGLDKKGSHTFLMTTFTSEIDVFGVKHLYISDTGITGYDRNGLTVNEYGVSDCGIKFSNNKYVLRYVIGV